MHHQIRLQQKACKDIKLIPYREKDPILMQSLRPQGEIKDAEIQKTEEIGGCAFPGEATQPNAT